MLNVQAEKNQGSSTSFAKTNAFPAGLTVPGVSKCDEERPQCRRCSQRNIACSYNQFRTVDPSVEGHQLLKPTVLWPGARSPDILVQKSSFFTMHDLDLLHHFVIAASPATLEDGGLIQISQEVPRMAFEVGISGIMKSFFIDRDDAVYTRHACDFGGGCGS